MNLSILGMKTDLFLARQKREPLLALGVLPVIDQAQVWNLKPLRLAFPMTNQNARFFIERDRVAGSGLAREAAKGEPLRFRRFSDGVVLDSDAADESRDQCEREGSDAPRDFQHDLHSVYFQASCSRVFPSWDGSGRETSRRVAAGRVPPPRCCGNCA